MHLHDWSIMKKIIRFIVFISAILTLLALVACGESDDFIELPNIEDVARIELGTISITDLELIENIMAILSEAEHVKKRAVEPELAGENLLKITPYMEVYTEDGSIFLGEIGTPILYLYTEDGNEYLLDNNDVFTIGNNNSFYIRQLYADLKISQVETYEEPEQAVTIASGLKLHVAEVSDELLSTFSYLHEFDYSNVHDENTVTDLSLVIWSNFLLHGFAVISFGNDTIDDELIYIPIDTFGFIDSLIPGDAFVINSYYTRGSMPWSGVTFVDESGTRRYFALIQDHSEQEGGWSLIEFENRTHELPPDWTPWWEIKCETNYIVVYASELPKGFAGFSFFLENGFTFEPEPWSRESGWFIISNGTREYIMSIGQFPNIGMSEKEYMDDLASIFGAYEPPTEDFPFYSFSRFIGASDSISGDHELEMQRFYRDNRKGGVFLIQIILLPEEWEKGYDISLKQALESFAVLLD